MITEMQQGKKTRLELYEMLETIDKAEAHEEKVSLIKKYCQQHTAVMDYLRCVFDPRIQFLLPDGTPPYTPNNEQNVPSSWHRQNTKLQYFVKGSKGEGMHPLKRETMFIGLLESVHPKDAEVLCDMLAKKSHFSGVTEEAVKEALPQYLS
jgi:hypothetical protein